MLHNFLKHFIDGKTKLFEERPKKDENITTYEITVGSYGKF